MNRDADFITKKLKELRAERVREEIANKRSEIELARFNARLTMFEDELKERGIPPKSETGARLIVEWLLSYFSADGRFDEEAFFQ